MATITFDVAAKALEPVSDVCKQPPEANRGDRKGALDVVRESTAPPRGRCIKTVNGFVAAVCTAYNNHHRLVLRPDDVWIAILVQFAAYVDKHAHELRSRLVAHADQKELVVEGDGTLYTADYEALAISMSMQIAEHLKDASVREWALPSFSTTTSNDYAAGAVALMASLRAYFRYKFNLRCGIPQVTLLGTVADWAGVEARARRLCEFEVAPNSYMAKWVAMLSPILAQFTATAGGRIDKEWWNRACHYHGGFSGPTYLSGWVTAFCVFDDAGNWVGDSKDKDRLTSEWPLIDTQDIPAGSVSVDVKVQEGPVVHDCMMIAGHASVWVPELTAIQPLVSWQLARKPRP